MAGLDQKSQDWIAARQRHRLSHAEVQMARELGMNPRKLGKIDNHRQEPWKMPLPQFIRHLYGKQFNRDAPAVVLSVEERARLEAEKKARKKEAKAQRKSQKAQTENAHETVETQS